MRTKALLCAAAMAAGAVASMAQSNVYSLNVVGYVNYPFTAFNYTLVNNPLDNTNNDLNTIIPVASDGSGVAFWSTGLQDFSPTAPVYSTVTGHWNPDSTVAPGQGFFVTAAAAFTNTFIGNVRQQTVTLNSVGGFNYECVGSTVPLGGGVTNQLTSYPATDGDGIAIWSVGLQDFSPTSPVYSTVTGHWNPDYNFTPGEGFFLIRAGGPVTWTRTFTVQ
jgi:hypothetical protein